MARSFEQIYSQAPRAAVGRLSAFRERYPYRHVEHHDMLYKLFDVHDEGVDGLNMVFLPSGLGSGEIWFPYMLELRRYGRCVAFSLASDEDPAQVADAFLDLLSELGIDKFVLIGSSIGGLLCQLIAARAPQRVEGMVLALTGTSAQALPEEIRQRWISRRQMKKRLRFQNYTPMDKMKMAAQVFESICPEPYREKQAFWEGFIEDVFVNSVYKAQHMAVNCALVPNLYQDFRFKPEDFSDQMPVLILESANDQTYLPQERDALRALFPQAECRDAGPVGQFALQINESECQRILENFILKIKNQ